MTNRLAPYWQTAHTAPLPVHTIPLTNFVNIAIPPPASQYRNCRTWGQWAEAWIRDHNQIVGFSDWHFATQPGDDHGTAITVGAIFTRAVR